MAGRQHLHRRGQGAGRRDVLEGQVPAQRVGVEVAQLARVGEGLALGREPQQPLGPGLASAAVRPLGDRAGLAELARHAVGHRGRWSWNPAGLGGAAVSARCGPAASRWPAARDEPVVRTERRDAVTGTRNGPASSGAGPLERVIRAGCRRWRRVRGRRRAG